MLFVYLYFYLLSLVESSNSLEFFSLSFEELKKKYIKIIFGFCNKVFVFFINDCKFPKVGMIVDRRFR